jgi:hypothetical protein
MALTLDGIKIEYRVSDGYVNATQMCRLGSKNFGDWHRLKSTVELIDVLEKMLADDGQPNKKCIETKKGRNGGSWIHPDLAIQLAQWLSPRFALQISKMVCDILFNKSVSIENKQREEICCVQTDNA